MGELDRAGIVIGISILLLAGTIPATMSAPGEAAGEQTTFTDDFSAIDWSEYEIVGGTAENWKRSAQIDGKSLHADFSDGGNGEILLDPERYQWAGARTIETDFQAEDAHWKKNGIIVFYDDGDRWVARVGVQGDAVTLGGPGDVSKKTPTTVADGAVHHLRVEIQGNQVQVYLDGQRYIDHEHESAIGAGPVGLSTHGTDIAHETWFDNLEVRGENVAETAVGQSPTKNPHTATRTGTPSSTAAPLVTAADEESTPILGTSGALLGGIGGMAGLGLGGFLLLRRGRSDDAGASTDASGGGAGSLRGMAETEALSEEGPSDGAVSTVDASEKAPPSPSDDETDVEDVAPGLKAEGEPGEAADGNATSGAARSPTREPGTQAADSDPSPSKKEPPAEPLESLDESLADQLDSDTPADRIDAVETISTRAAAGEIDAAAAVEVLDHQFQAEDDSDVRVAVIEALGSVGNDRAVSLLEAHRLDVDTAVSKAASETLRDLDT